MLNEQDIRHLEKKGITREAFLQQIEHFKTGFPPLILDRPATIGDGIEKTETVDDLAGAYDKEHGRYMVSKFVPASGAATRMFKDVFAWRDLLNAGVDAGGLMEKESAAAAFFKQMHRFAFWDKLRGALEKDGFDAKRLTSKGDYLPLVDYLLFEHGLNYASLPKALIAFHRYKYSVRTAMEEHLVEGAEYARGAGDVARIHFTLSPEHIGPFEETLANVLKTYEEAFAVSYSISHSVQKPYTDTIAVGLDNLPFREGDNSLLFRPGGHGSLIENLNDLDDDVIFIKNIDNVVPDRLKGDGMRYKKALGGLLLNIKTAIDAWMRKLDKGPLSDKEYAEAVDFAVQTLNVDPRVFPGDKHLGCRVLYTTFDRPLRVCGMVKNEGEPGGGPFWVKDKRDGTRSLQIVEMSQIDMDNPKQAELVRQATHFNPVDIVCSVKKYTGEKYDLNRFVDRDTGFISHKSKDGKELKALERPGLWNGAMAFWNTVFMEVPLITFNPVKTINDLLREEHQ